MKVDLPDFADKASLIDYMIANKGKLIAQKKSVTKEADPISHVIQLIDKSDNVIKSTVSGVPAISADATQIKVRSIINTTKLFDSHGDVHLDQLWNKSLKEGTFYLVQEHNFSFSGIISDNVKAFTKQMSWHELGINYEGKTQALVFDSVIDKETNPFMFGMYRTGKVKQHSVGMQYVKIELAVNDDRYEKEFGIWEKYFQEIANKEDSLEFGYFWAIQEAKIIEGSAVIKGSNWATPTTSVTQTKTQAEPLDFNTRNLIEPGKTPLKASDLIKFYKPTKHI